MAEKLMGGDVRRGAGSTDTLKSLIDRVNNTSMDANDAAQASANTTAQTSTNTTAQTTENTQIEKTEVGVIHSKARPVGIYIQLKNGNKVYIWPSYTTKTFKDGWSAAPVEDKFVLNIEDNGQDKYYTILSGDVAKYLREGWKDDMPMVGEIALFNAIIF